ncbi:MAG: APC family permease [Candidatus Obscuribacterales bacterium]|nr:APC family permease [Candidatus Obscuribacterales bacterium]
MIAKIAPHKLQKVENTKHGLRNGVLSPLETLGQSIAGIAPSATPGMLIPIVFGFAGNGTWLTYIVATIGIIFTAQCINEFTSRSACPGSLYSFVNQELGVKAGMLTGWALMFAYIFCGAACATEVAVYASTTIKQYLGLELNSLLLMSTSATLAAVIACKNIKMSASLMLRLEFISIGLILFLVVATILSFGFKPDLKQLTLAGVNHEQVRTGLVMAIFSFVAFESSASLGVEAKDPLKNIPKAITLSVLISGLFFVACSYAMVLSFHGASVTLDKCSTPMLFMSEKVNMPVLGELINIGVTVGFFGAALANLNAASRIIMKMSHDGIFPAFIGRTHKENHTPYVAIILASIIGLGIAMSLAALNCPLMDIVGWAGSLGTFGFMFGYFITSLSAGNLLKRNGALTWKKTIIVSMSLSVLMLSFIGSLYPCPAYPYNLLPFIFSAYMIVGIACSFKLKGG